MTMIRDESERQVLNLGGLGIENAVLLGRYAYFGARSNLQTHAHPGIMEIVYCANGQQIYEVNQQQFVICGGDVFITFPGEPHSTANHPEEKGSVYWLQIEIPENRRRFLGYRDENASGFLDGLLKIPARHFKGNPMIKTGFDEIFQRCKGELTPYSKLSVHTQLAIILQYVIECSAAPQVVAGNNLRIEKVKKYIDEHLNSNLSIHILAGQHHISESHFKKWFKEQVGITPMDYITRRKIERAKHTLSQNRAVSIVDIAFELNFSSSQYFSTVFKKYAGITPLAYRSSLK
jgi:AraC-like DNA-binding protein/quercetin dioxygenase-like cupin family protein